MQSLQRGVRTVLCTQAYHEVLEMLQTELGAMSSYSRACVSGRRPDSLRIMCGSLRHVLQMAHSYKPAGKDLRPV
jgi:hypothetical protein